MLLLAQEAVAGEQPSHSVRPVSGADIHGLYVEHGAHLRSALRRLTSAQADADDLLQEVFTVAIKRSAQLGKASSPKAWLFGVAVKVAANWRRRFWLRRTLGLEAAVAEETVTDTQRMVDRHEAEWLVARGIEAISGKKREVFVLFEIENVSGLDIAAALDIPLKTVWTRLFHARAQFAAHVAMLEGRGAP